jgi:hypothetical protein
VQILENSVLHLLPDNGTGRRRGTRPGPRGTRRARLVRRTGRAASRTPRRGRSSRRRSLCIGALLATIAVLLARETTSLLIGEAAVPKQISKIQAALLAAAGVDRVIHLRTVHLGPDELLVAGKIGVSSQADGADIATTIDDAEARVREALPSARIIYLEPDIYRPEPTVREAAALSPRPTPPR